MYQCICCVRAAPELCEVTVRTPFRTTDSVHPSQRRHTNTDHMTASRLRLTSARLSEESSSCDHSEFVKGSWAAHPVARAFVLTFIRDICSPLFCASCDMLGRCGMIAQPWPFLCTLQATAQPQVLLCTNISWKILFEGVKSLLSTLRQRWSD